MKKVGPTALIEILWKRRYFKVKRSLWDIQNEMEKLGFWFTKNAIRMAIKRSDFLIRWGSSGKVPAFKQKYPPELPSEIKIISKESDFDNYGFHPKIVRASKSLFESEHYAQAIFEAFKNVEIYTKEKSGVKKEIGYKLMMNVFNPNNPKLKINKMQTDSEKDEQSGYRHIFAGAMLGIKNPKSHDNVIQTDSKRTLQLLSLADLLMKLLDISFPPGKKRKKNS